MCPGEALRVCPVWLLLELKPRDAAHHKSDHGEAEECESGPGEVLEVL